MAEKAEARAAPLNPLTDGELDDLRRDVIGWTGGNVKAAYAGTASGQILRAISDLRSARARVSKMEAAIRWAMGEQPLADGRWFDSSAFGHLDNAAPVYWWRTILRLYSGLADGNAAQPPPDSVSESVELREARRLLVEALSLLDGSYTQEDLDALRDKIREHSDRERSSPPAVPDPVKVQ